MSLFRALYAIRRAPHSIRRRDGTRRRENRENVVDTKNLVSITEANQNFSRVARLVDENGVAVILNNNVPRYVLVEYSQVENEQTAEDEDVMAVSRRRIAKNHRAYEELANEDPVEKQVLALHSDLIREFGHGGDSGRRAAGIRLGRTGTHSDLFGK